jgi:hypothetical protein
MPEIGFTILMILLGFAMVWYFWDADIDKNIFDAYEVEGRYGGYIVIIMGIFLTIVEIPNILSPKWVSLLSLITGLLLCVCAATLTKWQLGKTNELFNYRHLTAQERRKENSQYAYIGLFMLFVLGLLLIILNL